jgi:shikimate kinase
MTVGKTHSGKTTFGKELTGKLGKYCLLDFDILVEFFKTTYPWLYNIELFKTPKDANDAHYLSLKVRTTIFKQALKTDLPIIFTNANTLKKLRKKFCTLAHKEGKKNIIIYFNRPEKVLLERIEKSKRSKICLTRSTDFQDLLLNRQSKIFEIPNPKEADIFIEITDDKSWKEAQKTILKLINNSK